MHLIWQRKQEITRLKELEVELRSVLVFVVHDFQCPYLFTP